MKKKSAEKNSEIPQTWISVRLYFTLKIRLDSATFVDARECLVAPHMSSRKRIEISENFFGIVESMLAEQLGADYDSPEVVGAEFVLTRWWIRRRIVFVEKFEHAPTICRWAKLVNLADKIANLSDIVAGPPADWPLKRATGILRLVQAVVDSLQRRTGPRPPARDHNNSSVSSLAIS